MRLSMQSDELYPGSWQSICHSTRYPLFREWNTAAGCRSEVLTGMLTECILRAISLCGQSKNPEQKHSSYGVRLVSVPSSTESRSTIIRHLRSSLSDSMFCDTLINSVSRTIPRTPSHTMSLARQRICTWIQTVCARYCAPFQIRRLSR